MRQAVFYVESEGGRGRGKPIPVFVNESAHTEIYTVFKESCMLRSAVPLRPSSPEKSAGPLDLSDDDEEEEELCLTASDFLAVTKDLCGFPLFFNAILFRRVHAYYGDGKERRNDETDDETDDETSCVVRHDEFVEFWKAEMEPFDDEERFFRLIKRPNEPYVVGSDFLPLIGELLDYHPGLEFLEQAPEFQEKYARTVVARILFRVNTSCSGEITRKELRNSDLLHYCHVVDEEEEINSVPQYFSYEHFYVLFCKFWELDSDNDLLLSKEDVMKHSNHSLTKTIVDRIFQQAGRPFLSGVDGRMCYEDFCFFLLAEEDKGEKQSIKYWFNCVDVDGDGVIREWELRHFYDEQLGRMVSLGHEEASFEDMCVQMNDAFGPKLGFCQFSLCDFLHPTKMQLSGVFFNLLFNLNKFVQFENRDPFTARMMAEEELTEWDRFTLLEYGRLANAEEDRAEDGDDGDGEDPYAAEETALEQRIRSRAAENAAAAHGEATDEKLAVVEDGPRYDENALDDLEDLFLADETPEDFQEFFLAAQDDAAQCANVWGGSTLFGSFMKSS